MKELSLNSSFGQRLPSPFILYGAGGEGVSCLAYLHAHSAGQCVLGVVDGDPQKQGRYLLSHTIENLDFIKKHPRLPIVITPAQYAAPIRRRLEAEGLRNELFIWLPTGLKTFLSGPFQHLAAVSDTPLVSSLETMLGVYEAQDSYTRDFLEFILFYRNDPWSLIQPYENLALLERFKLEARYFTGDQEARLKRQPELTFVDCGAYNGGTLKDVMARFGGRVKKIYSLEPDPGQFAALKKTTEAWPGVAVPLNAACGAAGGPVAFAAGGDMGSHVSPQGNFIASQVRLDDLGLEIQGRLCVKMDVEGQEMPALTGAAQLITRHRPELAICLYHTLNDLYAVPAYLKTLAPEYKCVLRGGFHLVCYAWIDS